MEESLVSVSSLTFSGFIVRIGLEKNIEQSCRSEERLFLFIFYILSVTLIEPSGM